MHGSTEDMTVRKARSLKMFMFLQPPNFDKRASPKARIRDDARLATKLRKLSINSVNYDQ